MIAQITTTTTSTVPINPNPIAAIMMLSSRLLARPMSYLFVAARTFRSTLPATSWTVPLAFCADPFA
jgi:hypothetical protein